MPVIDEWLVRKDCASVPPEASKFISIGVTAAITSLILAVFTFSASIPIKSPRVCFEITSPVTSSTVSFTVIPSKDGITKLRILSTFL